MTKKQMIHELVKEYVRSFEYGTPEWKKAFCEHDLYESRIDRVNYKERVEYFYKWYWATAVIDKGCIEGVFHNLMLK
jgi:hypothetical protein